MQPHGQTQPGLAQHGHQLPGGAGGVQQTGGLLHKGLHLLGGGPVPAGLHEQEEDGQAVLPVEVVTQLGQLAAEVPGVRPVPHRHGHKGLTGGHARPGQQLLTPGF